MHSTPSLEDFCRNIAMMFGVEKTRMAWLTDSEKKLKMGLFVLTEFKNVTNRHRDTQTNIQRHTDKHTDTAWRHRLRLHSIAWQKLKHGTEELKQRLIMPQTVGKEAISVAFVRPSVRPFVAYIANNSRTRTPSVPKFETKVPTSDVTSIVVSRSKGQSSRWPVTRILGHSRINLRHNSHAVF